MRPCRRARRGTEAALPLKVGSYQRPASFPQGAISVGASPARAVIVSPHKPHVHVRRVAASVHVIAFLGGGGLVVLLLPLARAFGVALLPLAAPFGVERRVGVALGVVAAALRVVRGVVGVDRRVVRGVAVGPRSPSHESGVSGCFRFLEDRVRAKVAIQESSESESLSAFRVEPPCRHILRMRSSSCALLGRLVSFLCLVPSSGSKM
eukprot:7224584-Pyramimonas_sp.AAC.1